MAGYITDDNAERSAAVTDIEIVLVIPAGFTAIYTFTGNLKVAGIRIFSGQQILQDLKFFPCAGAQNLFAGKTGKHQGG